MTTQPMTRNRDHSSWAVRSTDCGWLTIADGGHAFGDEPDALIFPTKKAAQAAMKGYKRVRGERIEYVRATAYDEAVTWLT